MKTPTGNAMLRAQASDVADAPALSVWDFSKSKQVTFTSSAIPANAPPSISNWHGGGTQVVKAVAGAKAFNYADVVGRRT